MENITARRAKARRTQLGLSQAEVARLCEIKQQSYNQLEAGVIRRPRYLLQLARALETTPEWLSGEGSDDAPGEAAPDGLDVEVLTDAISTVRKFYGDQRLDPRTEAEHVIRLYQREISERKK